MSHFSDAIPVGFAGSDTVVRYFFGGDHLQVFYNGWKLKQNLITPGASVFSDPYNFASVSGVFYDAMIGMQYLQHAFFSFFFSDIFAYNFSHLIISTTLCAFFSHLFFTHFTSSRWQLILSALIMSWLPYRIRQIAQGHSGGVVAYFMPLFLYAILSFRKTNQQRYSLLAGLSLFLITISDEHQGYYLLIASMFIFPIWFFQHLSEKDFTLKNAIEFPIKWRLLLLGLAATLGWGFFLNTFILHSNKGSTQFARTLGEIGYYSKPIMEMVRPFSEFSIGDVYFWVLLFLSPVGIYFLLKKNFAKEVFTKSLLRSPLLPFFVFFPIGIVLTLGVGSHWSQKTHLYQLFYKILPYFKYQRVPIKMFYLPALIAIIAFPWLANFIEAKLIEYKKPGFARGVKTAVILIIVLQFAEYSFGFNRRLLMDTVRVDENLVTLIKANTTAESLILVYPASCRMDRYATLSTQLAYRTQRRYVQGYTGTPPESYEREVEPFVDSINALKNLDEIKSRLKKIGVTTLLVGEKTIQDFKDDPEHYDLKNAGQIYGLGKKIGCADSFCLVNL